MPEKLPSAQGHRLTQEDTQLLERTRKITAESRVHTAKVNWAYVFRHVEPCKLALRLAHKGYDLEIPELAAVKNGGSQSQALMNAIANALSGSSGGSFKGLLPQGAREPEMIEFLKTKLAEAIDWEKRTSLAGVAADKVPIVMRERLARCIANNGVLWATFFCDADNRRYVLEQLTSDNAGMEWRALLKKISEDLTARERPGSLATFAAQLPKSEYEDPLGALIEYLSIKN